MEILQLFLIRKRRMELGLPFPSLTFKSNKHMHQSRYILIMSWGPDSEGRLRYRQTPQEPLSSMLRQLSLLIVGVDKGPLNIWHRLDFDLEGQGEIVDSLKRRLNGKYYLHLDKVP